jgi:hypothetical protein
MVLTAACYMRLFPCVRPEVAGNIELRPKKQQCAYAGIPMPRWVTLCLGVVLFVQPAAADPIDERVFSAFEALCLDNIREIGRVPSFAGAIGMVELNGEKAKPLLDGHAGHAWVSGAKETARYALMLTDEGSCMVTGPDANGKEVLALFLSNSRNQRLSTEKIGSSVRSVFAVTHPSRRGLAMRSFRS